MDGPAIPSDVAHREWLTHPAADPSRNKLSSKEGNIDHVVPRSRGGKTSWDNCVLAHHEINSRKANRLPHEAGLRLRKQPTAPRVVPASAVIRNHHGVPDWQHFLI